MVNKLEFYLSKLPYRIQKNNVWYYLSITKAPLEVLGRYWIVEYIDPTFTQVPCSIFRVEKEDLRVAAEEVLKMMED